MAPSLGFFLFLWPNERLVIVVAEELLLSLSLADGGGTDACRRRPTELLWNRGGTGEEQKKTGKKTAAATGRCTVVRRSP
jgi:hypothetical protein